MPPWPLCLSSQLHFSLPPEQPMMHNSTQAEPLFATVNPQSGGLTLITLVATDLNEEQRLTYRGLYQNFQKEPTWTGIHRALQNFSALCTMTMYYFFEKEKRHIAYVLYVRSGIGPSF